MFVVLDVVGLGVLARQVAAGVGRQLGTSQVFGAVALASCAHLGLDRLADLSSCDEIQLCVQVPHAVVAEAHRTRSLGALECELGIDRIQLAPLSCGLGREVGVDLLGLVGERVPSDDIRWVCLAELQEFLLATTGLLGGFAGDHLGVRNLYLPGLQGFHRRGHVVLGKTFGQPGLRTCLGRVHAGVLAQLPRRCLSAVASRKLAQSGQISTLHACPLGDQADHDVHQLSVTQPRKISVAARVCIALPASGIGSDGG